MGTTEIKQLDTFEVSLVHSPANNRKFMLWKSAEGVNNPMGTKNSLDENKILEFLKGKSVKTFDELIKKMNLSDDARTAVGGALKILSQVEDELPENLLMMLEELLSGSQPPGEGGSGGGDGEGGDMTMSKESEIAKALASLIHKQNGSGKKEVTLKGIDDLKVDDDVKNQLRSLWKSNEDLKEELRKEKEAQEVQAFINKAKEFSNLPINPDEFGKLLKTISQAGEKTYGKMEEFFKSMNEVLKENEILKEKGSNLGGYNLHSDAMTEIKKAASALKASDPKMTDAIAMAKAMEANPALYEKYLEESEKRR